MPKRADVVVVGGGITGACTALYLAERGLTVVICEKGSIAGEASGRALGKISSLYLSGEKSDLILRAKQQWRELDARIDTDMGYRESGLISCCVTDQDLERATDWVQSVQGIEGFDPRIIDHAELQKMLRVGCANVAGAILHGSDSIVEPVLATTSIVEAARKSGVEVFQNCAVRGLEVNAGEISAVITEIGAIATDRVVLAGGAWSSAFCRNIGIDLPQLRAFASVMRIAPLDNGPAVSGSVDGVSWRNELDGGYSIALVDGVVPLDRDFLRYGRRFLPAAKHMWREVSVGLGAELFRTFREPARWELNASTPFEKVRVLQPVTRHRALDRALVRLCETVPAFKRAVIRERWAGALVTTPDNMPILSQVDEVPGLTLGTGLYFGLTMAPAVGEFLADLVTDRKPSIDRRPYRYQRFFDGSKLVFQH